MNESPVAVFDLGMVLAEPIGLYASLGAILGVPPEQVAEVYYIHRRVYDMGLPDRDYWTRTLAELGVERDLGELLETLVATDMAGWSTIRPGAEAILRDLGAAGVDVVVLSNAPGAYVEAARNLPWRDLASQWFFSASLGLTKPDPAIYRHVEWSVPTPPEQLWFIDDRPENVAAAVARRWNARLWKSDDDTRRWLCDAGLLPEA